MSSSSQLPIQQLSTSSSPLPQITTQSNQSASFPLQNVSMNQMNNESNKLRSDFKSTSIHPAELIRGFPQRILDVELNSDRKLSNSNVNKTQHNVQNKELLILIKRLISLFMMMTMNAKTCSPGSKTAIPICLQQTLMKLKQQLTKQQMKVLLTNVISRQLSIDAQRQKVGRKLKLPGMYQKAI